MNFQKELVRKVWSTAKAAVLLCVLSTASYAGAIGVSVSPGSLNFGSSVVGARSAAETVTVTNNTRESVKMQSVSLSSLQFAYSGPAFPVTLAPGQSFNGAVLFLPTAAKTYSARLTFETNRFLFGSTTVALSGTGTAQAPALKTTPTISWTAPSAISYGTALGATQLDASASAAGSFAYAPALGTVLNAGGQTLSVTFTPSDTTDYNTATGSAVLTVNKATTTISWAAPPAISYGTALGTTQLDASANAAGSFAYAPALGTALNAGSQTLSVTFTPTNTTDYNTATGSVMLKVNKVTPAISWAAPTAITTGTALSATQLDAAANTAGSFTYAPALGTAVSTGSQTLSVTFTPTNTTDYNTATDSVVLTVNSTTPPTGTLTVNPVSVAFGNVTVGASSSQTIDLVNSGSGSVAISNVSVSAPGVSVSGVSAGMILASGQSASVDLTFAASSTGSVTGGVTIASNASDSSLTIPLSASGVSNTVSLLWSTDASATGGYNVYSGTTSGGPYNRLTSALSTPAYTDGTVQAGLTYYYVVTAIDATTNVESGYSNQATVVIP